MWPAEIVDQAVWWSDVVGIMFFWFGCWEAAWILGDAQMRET